MSELALKLIAENKAKYERGEDASELNLENCGLHKFPFEIINANWLHKLNLSNNQSLKNLAGIETLNELTFINIAYTSVTGISALNNLANINSLYLHNTKIKSLHELDMPRNLINLSLFNTKIYSTAIGFVQT